MCIISYMYLSIILTCIYIYLSIYLYIHVPRLAGIMMEALQGEGGVTPGEKTFFRTVRDICDETGAVMIVDEVQTGMTQ